MFTDTAYFLCRHVQVALPGKVIRAELILDQRRVRSIGRNSPYCCAHHIPIGVTSTKTSDQVASMFAASCGSFRDMRLAGAFFANRAEIVDDMLNVEGGFWASTTVPAQSAGFQCSCVALCDTRRRDIGTDHRLHIDAAGNTGQRWAPAWSTNFQLPSATKFMVLSQIALPIEPDGGRHVYSFQLEGSHERFDIPLDVVVR